MKKLRSNLKKEDIALVKGYRMWYRIVDGKVRVFINEGLRNAKGDLVNRIYWHQNRAELCTDVSDYCKKFYNQHKEADIEFFIKPDSVNRYTEYEVKEWGLKNNVIEVLFVE